MKNLKVVEMFELIKNGDSLVNCFKKLAEKWGMTINSVRNFYYSELKKFKNPIYASQFDIDVSNISKQEFVLFNSQDKEMLVKEILIGKSKGESVRSICLRLSGGDANKMIRFQNKYRALLKNNPEFVSQVANKYDLSFSQPVSNKVVKIRSASSRLSDSEINSLFMGLVRLIKNSSVLEVSSVLKKECNIAHKTLQATREKLRFVQEELIEEKRKNKHLSSKLNSISEDVKMSEYRAYLKSLKSKTLKED